MFSLLLKMSFRKQFSWKSAVRDKGDWHCHSFDSHSTGEQPPRQPLTLNREEKEGESFSESEPPDCCHHNTWQNLAAKEKEAPNMTSHLTVCCLDLPLLLVAGRPGNPCHHRPATYFLKIYSLKERKREKEREREREREWCTTTTSLH